MARQLRKGAFEAPTFTPEQEVVLVQMFERHLVKLGVINHRRCASCEWFCPLGDHCLKHDGKVPADWLPVGCDDWTQVMPL